MTRFAPLEGKVFNLQEFVDMFCGEMIHFGHIAAHANVVSVIDKNVADFKDQLQEVSDRVYDTNVRLPQVQDQLDSG